MRQQEAIDIVNKTTFRPGWRWSARPGYYSWQIIVSIELDTVDTSAPGRDGSYTVPRVLAWPHTIDVRRMDSPEELLYRLLLEVQETQEHEDREFLRYWDGQAWVAPFHPHRELGNAKWHSVKALAGMLRRERDYAR